MAQWQIQHGCGHSETRQIYGPERTRKAQADGLKQTRCPDCRSATGAALKAAGSGLTGSDKQIAWASQIRSAMLPRITALADSLGDSPEHTTLIRSALLVIETEESARWWIDHRDQTPQGVLQAICRTIQATRRN